MFIDQLCSAALKDWLVNQTCTCNNTVCGLVGKADYLLSPLTVMFCLTASSLLYVNWKNVGRMSRSGAAPCKPIYKFYGSYKGAVLVEACCMYAICIEYCKGRLETCKIYNKAAPRFLSLNVNVRYLAYNANLMFFMIGSIRICHKQPLLKK